MSRPFESLRLNSTRHIGLRTVHQHNRTRLVYPAVSTGEPRIRSSRKRRRVDSDEEDIITQSISSDVDRRLDIYGSIEEVFALCRSSVELY